MRWRLNLITRKRRNTCNVHKCFDAINRARKLFIFDLLLLLLLFIRLENWNECIDLAPDSNEYWPTVNRGKSRLPRYRVTSTVLFTIHSFAGCIQIQCKGLLEMDRVSLSVSRSVIDMLEKQKWNERRWRGCWRWNRNRKSNHLR